MLSGKQTGILWTKPGTDGIEITVHEGGYGYDYVKIVNGQRLEGGIATYKEVYDQNQGCDVPGIELLDSRGQPTGEVYKLRDFHMSGNLSYGRLF
jgi:hypothetical protein